MIRANPFEYSFPNNITEPYNLTVTCFIHHDSTADRCEVRARDDSDLTRIGKHAVHIFIDL